MSIAGWEGEIIEKARQIANLKQDDNVSGHIPGLICSRDFDGDSTKKFARLWASHPPKVTGHRLLREMPFRQLCPITHLTGDRFWEASWDCYRCKCTRALCNMLTLLRCLLGHHHFWNGGVGHNESRGVLNDYDLAHDLLTEEALAGKGRATLPSRLRVVCVGDFVDLLHYDNGKEISNAPFGESIAHDYDQCLETKMCQFLKAEGNCTHALVRRILGGGGDRPRHYICPTTA